MMEIVIIVGLIMLIIGVICLSKEESGWAFLFGVMGAYTFSGGLMMLQENYKPKAMDVYQGKTTLEYTIKDGVVVKTYPNIFSVEKDGHNHPNVWLICHGVNKHHHGLRWMFLSDYQKLLSSSNVKELSPNG
jgi:membrane-bound ClpP family serine protease